MDAMLQFPNREEFRKWLSVHCLSSDGIWLLFGKAGGPVTITASQALEEALNTKGKLDSVVIKITAVKST